MKIQSQNYEHPALTFFNRSSNGRLDSADFSSWYQLTCDEKQKKDKATFNILSLENGDPLLVERPVGRGRVLQWATSCGERWSNLPLREVFVPMLQQLVIYSATAATPPLNLETGQRLAVTWQAGGKSSTDSSSSNKAASPTGMVDLLTPQGTRYRLEIQSSVGGSKSDELAVQFANTQFPGVYKLSGVRDQPLAIAVGTRVEESDLTPLSSHGLRNMAERLEAQIQPSGKEFWQAEQVKQTGREVWRWLLIALVAFLFAELLLQQSLTRTPA